MKKIILFSLVILLSFPVLSAQNNQVKKDPVGTWKFEAPLAPEGYTSGIIEVGFPEKKYSASLSFAGSEYKITGEKVTFEKEILSFSVYIEDQSIAVSIKMENGTKMSGKAVYSEGEIPLTLIKSTGIKESVTK